MKRHQLVFGTVICFFLLLTLQAKAQETFLTKDFDPVSISPVRPAFSPDEFIVKFKAGIPQIDIDILNSMWGLQETYTSAFAGFKKFKIPAILSVPQLVNIYKMNPLVEYAEPDYIAYAAYTPNDPYYNPYQWNFNAASGSIKMPSAWDITKGNQSVKVAVIDTGVAYENFTQTTFFSTKNYYKAPDLESTTFVPGYDFVNNDTHPNDDEGHGTHVAGTIAQSTGNGVGAAGIAFQTSIMPIKVLDANGSGSYAAVADGIKFAADNGAKVINLSLGGPAASTTLQNALAYAYNKGVTIVCAAGNDGQSTLIYPAAYNAYCIAVGATRYDETRTFYSNYGTSLDVMAPGGDINVDQNGDGLKDGILQQTFGNKVTNNFGYYLYQGTSMAAPHVSGIAALLLAKDSLLTPDKVREIIQSTTKDLGAAGVDANFGWGLVNAFAALSYNPIPNTAPVAQHGGPYTGTEDLTVQFNGSQSSDVNGDPLTYSWTFGDGTNGSGVNPTHVYTAGGNYAVSLIVNDGKVNSSPAVTNASITEVNDPPIAEAAGPYSGGVGQSIAFNGNGSFDPDGNITAYEWNFGDGTTGTGVNPSHSYAAQGTYTATLKVTDNQNAQSTDQATATITVQPPQIQVFADSFEVGEWNGLWSEDSQNDWFRSSQRANPGNFSAEVDGGATDALLTSGPINLQGKTNATITFAWYIESSLDAGEYVAFDISTNNGGSWTEMQRIRGNVDQENTWQQFSVSVNGINQLRLRFRGRMTLSDEDANVDNVKVMAQ